MRKKPTVDDIVHVV